MKLVNMRLSFYSCLILLALVAAVAAQENPADKTAPLTKKSAAGVEVTLLEVKPAKDFDAVNRVPTFRMGSCPPGAAMPGFTIQSEPGRKVIIVQIALKFPGDYSRADFPIPVMVDANGKKYSSGNMMAPSKELVPRIKSTGEQLKCEIPFELPAGTDIIKLQYVDVFFDLKPGPPTK